MVCGGEHITASPEFCMKDCPEIDICIFGEGEETSVELLNTLRKKKSLFTVNGIVFKSSGKLHRNPNRARIRDRPCVACVDPV